MANINVSDNTLIEDMTFIDNYVYLKTSDVPVNYDYHSIGWVIKSKNGSSNNVTFKRVSSYSTNALATDGSYRTRGFTNLLGNGILIDSCELYDCRNAIRMGINSTNLPQWNNITIKNCRFKNVEQCIDLLNNLTLKNCTVRIVNSSSDYLMGISDNSGGICQYTVLDGISIVNCLFDGSTLTSSTVLFGRNNFGTPLNIRYEDNLFVGNYLALHFLMGILWNLISIIFLHH